MGVADISIPIPSSEQGGDAAVARTNSSLRSLALKKSSMMEASSGTPGKGWLGINKLTPRSRLAGSVLERETVRSEKKGRSGKWGSLKNTPTTAPLQPVTHDAKSWGQLRAAASKLMSPGVGEENTTPFSSPGVSKWDFLKTGAVHPSKGDQTPSLASSFSSSAPPTPPTKWDRPVTPPEGLASDLNLLTMPASSFSLTSPTKWDVMRKDAPAGTPRTLPSPGNDCLDSSYKSATSLYNANFMLESEALYSLDDLQNSRINSMFDCSCAGEKLCMAVSKCGGFCVVGTAGFHSTRRVEVWDTERGECVKIIQETDTARLASTPRFWVEHISVTERGDIVCGTNAPSIVVYSLESERIKWESHLCGAIRCLDVTNGEEKHVIVSCNEEVTRVLDMANGAVVREIRRWDVFATSPTGKWVAAYRDGGAKNNTFSCSAIDGNGVTNLVTSGDWAATVVAVSPCSHWVVAGCVISEQNVVQSWYFDETFTPSPATTYSGHSDTITAVQVSQCGTWMLSGSIDKSIIKWDLASGAKLGALSLSLPKVESGLSIFLHRVQSQNVALELSKCGKWVFFSDGATLKVRSTDFPEEGKEAEECPAEVKQRTSIDTFAPLKVADMFEINTQDAKTTPRTTKVNVTDNVTYYE